MVSACSGDSEFMFVDDLRTAQTSDGRGRADPRGLRGRERLKGAKRRSNPIVPVQRETSEVRRVNLFVRWIAVEVLV